MTEIEKTAKQFGKQLQSIMKQKSCSASRLASLIGIDRASFTKYFKGESSPRIDTFFSICKCLKITPNDFFSFNKEDNSEKNLKTKEQKIIESLFCLCENGIIKNDPSFNTNFSDYPFILNCIGIEILETITQECLRFAGSELNDDANICEKIVHKYEPRLKAAYEKKNSK